MVTVTMIVLITLAILVTTVNVAIALKANKIAEHEKADRGDF